ncbi:MAG: MBL fold metallo-hydrolase [Fimbriimonadales bacterium]
MAYIERLPLGILQANCYLVQCTSTREAVVIDPGMEAECVLERLRALGNPPVVAILATHGHFDHVVGVRTVKQHTGAPFWISEVEWELWAQHAHEHPVYLNLPPGEPVPPPDRFLREGDEFTVGELQFEVLALRGHAPDHLGFLLKNTQPMHLFCGDAIFAGSVGRTDIPYADLHTLREHLRTRVLTLPDDTILHPGHGPDTTVGIERATNPYL